jgi:hypothetical protein
MSENIRSAGHNGCEAHLARAVRGRQTKKVRGQLMLTGLSAGLRVQICYRLVKNRLKRAQKSKRHDNFEPATLAYFEE